MIPGSSRFPSRCWIQRVQEPGSSPDVRPIYTAPTAAAARDRFEEFAEKWGKPYPAIVRLWENAWAEFIPFLDYDVEIRKVICST
ncbi:transposase, partial [Aestuariimicrobium sp. p3-SID1156]|uniref:transposase n=1 Tax=Aestuariimicrobium sp. p3-SID1156 TaxID=2916038 RepID=UPI0037BF94DC